MSNSFDPVPLNPKDTERLLKQAAESIRASEATLERARSAADELRLAIFKAYAELAAVRHRLETYRRLVEVPGGKGRWEPGTDRREQLLATVVERTLTRLHDLMLGKRTGLRL